MRKGSVMLPFLEKKMKNYDAILLLGLKLNADGSPKEELRLRVEKAVSVYREKKIPCIIPCGGQTPDTPVSEAKVMEQMLLHHGVSPDAILIEEASQVTVENIQNARNLLKEKGIRKPRVLVVTSDYHAFRAVFMARHMGMKAKAETCKTLPGKEKRHKQKMELFYFINYAAGWETGKRKRPTWYDKGVKWLQK